MKKVTVTEVKKAWQTAKWINKNNGGRPEFCVDFEGNFFMNPNDRTFGYDLRSWEGRCEVIFTSVHDIKYRELKDVAEVLNEFIDQMKKRPAAC